MNSLNNSAGVRANIEGDGDSLATWLRENFKQHQRSGGRVTMTDTREQRDGGQE